MDFRTGADDAMDLNNLKLFGLMGRRMSWLTQRQTVLAQNISNADTPEYRPKDLTQASFRRMLEPGRAAPMMTLTSGAHLQPVRRPEEFRADKADDVYETALSGNAVVLEEQLMKVSETQGAYRLVTNLYSKHVSMLKSAIGRER